MKTAYIAVLLAHEYDAKDVRPHATAALILASSYHEALGIASERCQEVYPSFSSHKAGVIEVAELISASGQVEEWKGRLFIPE